MKKKEVMGGVLLGVLATAVLFKILGRETPELVEKIKGWFTSADDFYVPKEASEE
jgi:hypothetical protein